MIHLKRMNILEINYLILNTLEKYLIGYKIISWQISDKIIITDFNE